MLPSAPNIISNPYTRACVTKSVDDPAIPDLSNSAFYRGFDIESAYQINNSQKSQITLWLDFNASYCNSIYGRDNTIKPLSSTCKFFIRYM